MKYKDYDIDVKAIEEDALYYPKWNNCENIWYQIVRDSDSFSEFCYGSYNLMEAVKMAIDKGYPELWEILITDSKDGFIFAKESVTYYLR